MSTEAETSGRKPRRRRGPTEGIHRKRVLKGTAYQKAALLIGHYATQVIQQPPLLTPQEEAALVAYFRSDGLAYSTYERYQAIDQAFRTAYLELNGRATEYELTLARIQFVLESLRNVLSKDQLLCTVSRKITELSDEKTAAAILKELEPLALTSFSSTEMIHHFDTQRTELRLIPDDRRKRLEDLFSHRANVLTAIKSWLVVIRRTFESHDFKIKPWIEFFDSLEQRVRKKYSLCLLSEDRLEELRQQAAEDPDDSPDSPYQRVIYQSRITSFPYQEYDEIEPPQNLLKPITAFFNRVPTVYGKTAK